MATKVDRFTANGTWTKPPGCLWVKVYVVGGGGGGGSGGSAPNGVGCEGGCGGGGGGRSQEMYYGPLLPDTVAITVGAKGVGGASATVTGGTVNGFDGTNAGFSAFGDMLRADGGVGGGQGLGYSGGQTTGTGGAGNWCPGVAGSQGATGTPAAINANTIFSPCYGGGGGKGQSIGNNTGAGGSSGSNSVHQPTGYVVDGVADQDGTPGVRFGPTLAAIGGSGGAYGFDGLGKGWKGGAGAFPGGGGGGASSAYGTAGRFLTGEGGDGADGLVVVVSFSE